MGLERFDPEVRHMIVFDVLSYDSPVGDKCDKMCLFLTDVGYRMEIADKRTVYGECTYRLVPWEDEPSVCLMHEWIYLPSASICLKYHIKFGTNNLSHLYKEQPVAYYGKFKL